MPIYYERKLREHVWFVHRVTWLDTVLWAIFKVFSFVFKMLWRTARYFGLGVYELYLLVVGSTARKVRNKTSRLDHLEW